MTDADPPSDSPAVRGTTRLGVKTRTFLALSDQAIVSIATFVTAALVARSSQYGMGLYGLVFTIWIFGTEIHNSLVSTPQMIKLPSVRRGRVREFNGSLLVHQLILSTALTLVLLTAALVLFLLASSFPQAGVRDYAIVCLAAAVSVAPLALRNFARSFCFAIRDVPSALMLDVGVSVIQVGGVALAFFLHRLEAHWWLAVVIVSVANLLSALHWLTMMRHAFLPRLRRAVVDFRRNWQLSRFILCSSLLWTAGTYLYVWMVSLLIGTASAGIWTACFQLANLGNPLITAIQNLMGPAISHAFVGTALTGFRRYVFKCTAVFTLIGGAGAACLAVLSEYLIIFFNGSQYAGYGPVSAVLAMTMLLQGMSFPTSRALFSLGRAKLDMYANIGPLIVMGALGVILIHRFGVMGAAICLVIAQLIGSVSRIIFFLHASAGERQPAISLADKSSAAA